MVMVYVPEGEFEMGSTEYDYEDYDDEEPVRQVYLDAYWIDRYEVSNGQYAMCVAAGACSVPSQTGSYSRIYYYGYPKYDDYPVIYVSWYDASDYCHWAGGDLPTEAQWEKAARGTDGRTHPWVDGEDNCSRANYYIFGRCVGETSAVGSYTEGASPYGALDMAGNVWEWVRDNYGPYQIDELDNPIGVTEGSRKVVRGGSWDTSSGLIRAANRGDFFPTNTYYDVGFRCSSPP